MDIRTMLDWNEIRSLRRYLHAHPELSGKEKETKKYLMAFLADRTDLELVEKGDWFYAHYEPAGQHGEGPVALRADMDALPVPEAIALPYGSTTAGIAHKCGHDGHSSALAAAALLLRKDARIHRPVYLIFQSAEETGKGGKSCADFLKEAGVEEVYAFHNLSGYPENAVMVRDRLTQCASKGLTVHFIGRKSHAGTPEKGRNPAQALARLALYAADLAEQAGTSTDKTLLLTIIGLNVGGEDFGISPGEGTFSVTLRADEESDLLRLENQLRDRARSLAVRDGLKVSFAERDPFPATVNTPRCAERVRKAACSLGLTLAPMPEPWRPSEDFGWYLKACPGAMFYVGNGMDWPAPHQPDYDFNDNILETAASLFLRLCEEDC